MRYIMRQRIFSFSDSFSIKDENEEDVYFVEGRVFSLGHKLSFQNISGEELLFIKQRLMSWRPTYEIYKGEELYAAIKKELFTFFKCRFEIEVAGSDNLEVEGDFLDHDYTFTRNGRIVATVSKQWLSWSDKYGIEIEDGEDDIFILACVVVIDMICHDDEHHH